MATGVHAQTDQSVSSPRTQSNNPNANTVTLISGKPGGTYLYFAYDMSAVLDDGNALRVLPMVGKGAAQNTRDLLYLNGVDMGITQSDIIRHFNKTGELGDNISDRLRYITRLYDEEMHVLANRRIKSLKDLHRRKVNFTEIDSGTQISSRLIFEALGIEVEEANMPAPAALEAMKRGELDATVLFGAKPASVIAELASEANGLNLIAVPYTDELGAQYQPATLTHEDYPQLIREGREVETVSVSAVLAVFNWAPDSDRYRRVAQFTEALFTKFGAFLEKPRHPKWTEVDPTANLPGWTRFAPAQTLIDRNQVATIGGSAAGSPEGELNMSESARERLFQAFVKWRQAQEAR